MRVEAVDHEPFLILISGLHITAVASDFIMFLYNIHYVKMFVHDLGEFPNE